MARFAIILASDQYSSFVPTEFCHADAQLLFRTLTESCDYTKANVVLRLLAPNDSSSPSEILTQIKELLSRSKPGDTILFFYAGHGTLHEGEPFIVLPNTTGLSNGFSDTALRLQSISDVLRHADRVCVRLFDACQSGADVRSGNPLDVEGFTRAIATDRSTGWFTFAACGENEFSHPDPNRQQGVFTAAFCDAISDLKPGVEVLPELVKIDVCNKVAAWSKRSGRVQTPQFNSSISGNLIFAIRKDLAQTTVAIESASLEEQLSKLRTHLGHVTLGGEEHQARFAADVELVKASIASNLKMIERFGASPSLIGPEDAGGLSDADKKCLVVALDKLGLRSVYKIEVREKTETVSQLTMLAGMFEPQRRVIRRYDIDTMGWPPSVITIDLESPDGLVPGARLMFYLVPYQLSQCLLYAHGVTGPSRVGTSRVDLDRVATDCFLGPGENGAIITACVTSALTELNARMEKVTGERIRYLNAEMSRISGE